MYVVFLLLITVELQYFNRLMLQKYHIRLALKILTNTKNTIHKSVRLLGRKKRITIHINIIPR